MTEDNVKSIIKKSKLQNTKEIMSKLAADDPILAIVIGAFYPTLLTMLTQAIFQNKPNMMRSVLEALAFITIFVILPILVHRSYQFNKNTKTAAEVAGQNALVDLKKNHEQQKQNRFNDLSQAKIANIQAQTNFILGVSENALVKTMRQKADNLQQGFSQETVQETMDELLGTMSKVIIRFNGIDAQYDQAMVQISEICDKLEIKVEDLVVEPLIDPKKSTKALQAKLDNILEEIPPLTEPNSIEASITELQEPDVLSDEAFLVEPEAHLKQMTPPTADNLWTCPKCKRSYKATIVKCRKCRTNRPT